MLLVLEDDFGIRFPRTSDGWRTLFWITLRLCPIHKRMLVRDPWAFGVPESTLYAFCCEGVAMYPRGFWNALRSNWTAHKESGNGVSEA